jgi:hypothetical protein
MWMWVIAYVRNLTSGKWFSHDDSRVSPARVGEIKSDAAYVLFYVRRGEAPWHKLPAPSGAPSSSSIPVDEDEDATPSRRNDGITISADRGGNSTTLYRSSGAGTGMLLSSVSSSSSSSSSGGVRSTFPDDEEGRGSNMDESGESLVNKTSAMSTLD